MQKIQLGDKKVMPFTIPSGIIMTDPRCAKRILEMVPEIGIWTTKSYTPQPREGNREPIIAKYCENGLMNAVGLTNPGAERGKEEIRKAEIPKDRVVLGSAAGQSEEEIVFVVRTLDDVVDAHEINFSCPHAKKHGMAIGSDPNDVYQITRAVCGVTRKPVIAKLTPNTNILGKLADAAMRAGAYGISAINTVGPGYWSVDGHAVLTNKIGGISGRAIIPIGIKCVRDVRQAIGRDIPIIGMGGIRTVRDIEEYAKAGANAFGIGSALAGMTDEDIRCYFSELVKDRDSNGWTNNASAFLREINMDYRKARVTEKIDCADDFKIFKTDIDVVAASGQFVFAWIPGIGEKPFSVMDDNPLTLGVLTRGEFTRALNSLQNGDSFYVRGPYGRGVDIPNNSHVSLVGGGCGIAGLHLLAKRFSEKALSIRTILGAKDKEHLAYLTQFEKYGPVSVATEDGSFGRRGLVTDFLDVDNFSPHTYFFNCGPKEMIEAVLPLELKATSSERIYSSLDYITSCGIGLCGKCVDEEGRRTCVYGPFMRES